MELGGNAKGGRGLGQEGKCFAACSGLPCGVKHADISKHDCWAAGHSSSCPIDGAVVRLRSTCVMQVLQGRSWEGLQEVASGKNTNACLPVLIAIIMTSHACRLQMKLRFFLTQHPPWVIRYQMR